MAKKIPPLTPEQENVVSAVSPSGQPTVKVSAFAGAGKTSTLSAVARSRPDMKFLYLAFNRAVKDAAKRGFPKNVTVLTTHGLAYRYAARSIDLSSVTGQFRASELKDALGLRTTGDAAIINSAFIRWCQSGEGELSPSSIAAVIKSDPALAHSIRKSRLSHQDVLLRVSDITDMMDTGLLSVTHDYYLKRFQLDMDKYDLGVDCVLLDEAQDTNGVVLAIARKFQRKVVVGDRHQQIYAFRGSVNAMDLFSSGSSLYLSSSFRMTGETADRASLFLKSFKGESVPIKGMAEPTLLPSGNTCRITRTNAGLIRLMDKLEKDNFTTVRNPADIFRTPLPVLTMFSYFKTKKEELKEYVSDNSLTAFESSKEMSEYAKDAGDVELMSAIDAARMFGGRLVAIKKAADEKFKNRNADIILTTAHTSKGLEWDRVVVEDDFGDIPALAAKAGISDMNEVRARGLETKGQEAENLIQEINLLYVAMTRTKGELYLDTRNAGYIGMPDDAMNYLLKTGAKTLAAKLDRREKREESEERKRSGLSVAKWDIAR